jgi:hypothetical protein
LQVPPPLPIVAVAVGVRVAVGVAVRLTVAVEVTRAGVGVDVAVGRAVVAVARAVVAVVAVAVARAVAVAVAVAAPLHVPLFVHQLSEDGLYGEFGGQSRVTGIAATAVYFDPLYVTEAPLAYAVQFANAGRPVQLTCAEAVAPDSRSAATTAEDRTIPIRTMSILSHAHRPSRCGASLEDSKYFGKGFMSPRG